MTFMLRHCYVIMTLQEEQEEQGGGGGSKNIYEVLNPRALKISMLYKNCIFQCMD